MSKLEQLVNLVQQVEAESPELLTVIESQFPNELAAIEACDEGLIPADRVEALTTFIEAELLLV